MTPVSNLNPTLILWSGSDGLKGFPRKECMKGELNKIFVCVTCVTKQWVVLVHCTRYNNEILKRPRLRYQSKVGAPWWPKLRAGVQRSSPAPPRPIRWWVRVSVCPIVQYQEYVTLALRDQNGDHSDWLGTLQHTLHTHTHLNIAIVGGDNDDCIGMKGSL